MLQYIPTTTITFKTIIYDYFSTIVDTITNTEFP